MDGRVGIDCGSGLGGRGEGSGGNWDNSNKTIKTKKLEKSIVQSNIKTSTSYQFKLLTWCQCSWCQASVCGAECGVTGYFSASPLRSSPPCVASSCFRREMGREEGDRKAYDIAVGPSRVQKVPEC